MVYYMTLSRWVSIELMIKFAKDFKSTAEIKKPLRAQTITDNSPDKK